MQISIAIISVDPAFLRVWVCVNIGERTYDLAAQGEAIEYWKSLEDTYWFCFYSDMAVTHVLESIDFPLYRKHMIPKWKLTWIDQLEHQQPLSTNSPFGPLSRLASARD